MEEKTLQSSYQTHHHLLINNQGLKKKCYTCLLRMLAQYNMNLLTSNVIRNLENFELAMRTQALLNNY